jgi:hypothetical protein
MCWPLLGTRSLADAVKVNTGLTVEEFDSSQPRDQALSWESGEWEKSRNRSGSDGLFGVVSGRSRFRVRQAFRHAIRGSLGILAACLRRGRITPTGFESPPLRLLSAHPRGRCARFHHAREEPVKRPFDSM